MEQCVRMKKVMITLSVLLGFAIQLLIGTTLTVIAGVGALTQVTTSLLTPLTLLIDCADALPVVCSITSGSECNSEGQCFSCASCTAPSLCVDMENDGVGCCVNCTDVIATEPCGLLAIGCNYTCGEGTACPESGDVCFNSSCHTPSCNTTNSSDFTCGVPVTSYGVNCYLNETLILGTKCSSGVCFENSCCTSQCAALRQETPCASGINSCGINCTTNNTFCANVDDVCYADSCCTVDCNAATSTTACNETVYSCGHFCNTTGTKCSSSGDICFNESCCTVQCTDPTTVTCGSAIPSSCGQSCPGGTHCSVSGTTCFGNTCCVIDCDTAAQSFSCGASGVTSCGTACSTLGTKCSSGSVCVDSSCCSLNCTAATSETTCNSPVYSCGESCSTYGTHCTSPAVCTASGCCTTDCTNAVSNTTCGSSATSCGTSCGYGTYCADAAATCISNVCCDGCVISGVCYPPNAVNSEELCLVCNPALSTTSWSDKYCFDNNACTGIIKIICY